MSIHDDIGTWLGTLTFDDGAGGTFTQAPVGSPQPALTSEVDLAVGYRVDFSSAIIFYGEGPQQLTVRAFILIDSRQRTKLPDEGAMFDAFMQAYPPASMLGDRQILQVERLTEFVDLPSDGVYRYNLTLSITLN